MSLQRVFETARKMGFPVIVTDVAGREPFVILPLEQFEGLIDDGSAPKPSISSESEIRTVQPLPAQPEAQMRIETIASQPAGESEIPLEERFYLEPVTD